jgi:hypothetical protein
VYSNPRHLPRFPSVQILEQENGSIDVGSSDRKLGGPTIDKECVVRSNVKEKAVVVGHCRKACILTSEKRITW